jgi:predicted membrane channel-forming protein YqfA (hemolysin III family)
MLLYYLLPLLWSLGLFAASFLWPMTASTVYVCSMWLLFLVVWAQDVLGRPKKQFHLSPDLTAIDHTIRKYHLWLRWSLGCIVVCSVLNTFNVFLLWWVPRLLWSKLWFHAGAAVLYYFATAPLRARLDPGSVYAVAARKGNPTAIRELTLIQSAQGWLGLLRQRQCETAAAQEAGSDPNEQVAEIGRAHV